MKILFIAKDEVNFSYAKMWSYSCQFGLVEGLENLGYEVQLVLSYQIKYLNEIIRGKEFDFCFMNCVLHLFNDDNALVNEENMLAIKSSCKKIVGFLVEHLEYKDENGITYPFSKKRLDGFNKFYKYFDGFCTFNRSDVKVLTEDYNTKTLWLFPTLPREYLLTHTNIKKGKRKSIFNFLNYSQKALVVASIYEGERKQFVKSYKNLLRVKKIYEKDIAKKYNQKVKLALERNEFNHVDEINLVKDIRALKKLYFNRYLSLINKSFCLLHPPSFFQDIHYRYIEAIAGGKFCLHPKPLDAYISGIHQDKKDLIFYTKENFGDIINRLQKNKDEYKSIINESSKRAVEMFTTENDMLRIINNFS